MMSDPAVAKKIQDVHWSTNPLPQRASKPWLPSKADVKVIFRSPLAVPLVFLDRICEARLA